MLSPFWGFLQKFEIFDRFMIRHSRSDDILQHKSYKITVT